MEDAGVCVTFKVGLSSHGQRYRVHIKCLPLRFNALRLAVKPTFCSTTIICERGRCQCYVRFDNGKGYTIVKPLIEHNVFKTSSLT